MSAPTTYAPGYLKGPDDEPYVRLLTPYLGETFSTLDEARAWVGEEEHDKHMQILYFEIRPVSVGESDDVRQAEPDNHNSEPDELRQRLMREMEMLFGPNLNGWPEFPEKYFGQAADRVLSLVRAAGAEPTDEAWANATEQLREWFIGIGIESFDNPRALAKDTIARVRAALAAGSPGAPQDETSDSR